MAKTVLRWDCVAPGHWRSGPYNARRHVHTWDLRHDDLTDPLYTGLRTVEDCKRQAQKREDALNTVPPEHYPVTSVRRVEIIDHRPGTQFWGKRLTAHVERTVLAFDDDNELLKVVLT